MPIIEVREKHDPAPPRKSGTIVTADGDRLDCWPTLLATMHVGRRYEVTTTTNTRGYTAIKIAKPAGGAAVAALAARMTAPPTPPAPIASDGEGEYVGHVVAALLLNGALERGQIGTMTRRLREVWRYESAPEAFQEAAE